MISDIMVHCGVSWRDGSTLCWVCGEPGENAANVTSAEREVIRIQDGAYVYDSTREGYYP